MKKKLNERSFLISHVKRFLRIMRLIFVLILVFSLHVCVYSQQTSLSLNYNDITIREVLNQIEKQSKFTFLLQDERMDIDQKINIHKTNASIETILDEIFANRGISYVITEKNQIIINPPKQKIPANYKAQQQKAITGNVKSGDGEPLPGVTILEKGTDNGSITDMDGNYSITVTSDDAILIFSYVGYLTEEISVAGKSVIDVLLVEDIQALEEIVVVGYGMQSKSVVTGAISSLKSEDMENTSSTRPEEALQGKASGVQVISSSGAPGASMKVRIRGYSSNGNSDPLYIVDGLRTDDISGLEPNNIASMEVLKDGASAAIYGAEGGNGVILITTKSGFKGETKVSYDFQYTVQSLGKTPEVMNAEQYITYMEESGALTGVEGNGIDTRWIDESFESSPMQKYNLTFSGGTEKTTYLASVSYLQQDGIVTGDKDKYKRYSGMFNGSQQLNDWLKFGSSVQLMRSVRNSFNEDDEYRGVIANAVLLDPLTPVKYTGTIPDRLQTLIDNGQPLLMSDDGYYYGISEYVEGETINPFVQNLQSQTESTVTKLMGNVYTDITPFKGFKFTSKLGLSYYSSNSHVYKPEYYYNAEMLNSNASVSEADAMMTYWQWENYASYVKSIKEHNFTVMVGTAISSRELKTVSASGYPLLKDEESYANLDYISSQSNSIVGGTTIEDNKFSYFARLNYDYNNKYLFQATVRRDAAGLSILPKEERWGTFPSFSAGWVISKENFFPEIEALTYFKIRGSWGQNGSLSNLGNYSYSSTIASSGQALSTIVWSYVNASYLYPLADGSYATASYPSVLGNNSLTWETSEQIDLGVDMHFFKGRLGLTIDYYRKTTKDLITENTPPLEAGNDASPINGGDVLNKGLEFDLNFRDQIGDFKYSVSTNFATLDNEVTYLDPTISRIDGASVNRWTATAFEKGMPVWYFRGYETNGIDPTTGDIIIVNKNEDDEITTSDYTYIGSAIPDFTYGATLNLQYKVFDFSLFMQGQKGNDILMGMIRTDRPTTNKLSLFYEERWTPGNTSASRPAATVDSRYWTSDQMIFDGSYLKIKQIQFGYTLPESVTSKLHIDKTRIYFSLDDFFTFTDYPGMDPEAASTDNYSIGIDRGYFPISKKVVFGLSLNF